MEADKTSNRKISRFDAVIPFLYRSILRRERKKKKKESAQSRNHLYYHHSARNSSNILFSLFSETRFFARRMSSKYCIPVNQSKLFFVTLAILPPLCFPSMSSNFEENGSFLRVDLIRGFPIESRTIGTSRSVAENATRKKERKKKRKEIAS